MAARRPVYGFSQVVTARVSVYLSGAAETMVNGGLILLKASVSIYKDHKEP